MPEPQSTEEMRNGRRVRVTRRPASPDRKPLTIPDDYLEKLGWRRWLKSRFRESLGGPPTIVIAVLFAPSLLLGHLLITLALLTHILPRDYMSRHHGNDMTMIEPLRIGYVACLLIIVGILVFTLHGLGMLITLVLIVVMVLWSFKEQVTAKLDQEHDFREYLRVRDQAVMVTETEVRAPNSRRASISTGWTENKAETHKRQKIWRFI